MIYWLKNLLQRSMVQHKGNLYYFPRLWGGGSFQRYLKLAFPIRKLSQIELRSVSSLDCSQVQKIFWSWVYLKLAQVIYSFLGSSTKTYFMILVLWSSSQGNKSFLQVKMFAECCKDRKKTEHHSLVYQSISFWEFQIHSITHEENPLCRSNPSTLITVFPTCSSKCLIYIETFVVNGTFINTYFFGIKTNFFFNLKLTF